MEARLAEAEKEALNSERRLRRVEGELKALRLQRFQLEAELESVGKLVAGELAEAEAERAGELQELLRAAERREREVEEQREVVVRQQAAAAEEVRSAKAMLRRERDRGSERSEGLWRRLKRQAVVGAAEVARLRESLSQTEAEKQAAVEEWRVEAESSRVALEDKQAKLSGLRGSMRAAMQVGIAGRRDE